MTSMLFNSVKYSPPFINTKVVFIRKEDINVELRIFKVPFADSISALCLELLNKLLVISRPDIRTLPLVDYKIFS